jgi:hypothetical protein
LNLRPPAPHAGALPDCATPRRFEKKRIIREKTAGFRLTFKDLQNLFQFHSHLANDLLTLRSIFLRGFARQLQACATDSIPLVVQQTANLSDQDHIVSLIITAISPPFDGFKLGKLLLPITQNMRLNFAQVAYLTDCKVSLVRNGVKLIIIAGFQHTPLLLPSVFARAGRLQPCARRLESPRQFWDFSPAADSYF